MNRERGKYQVPENAEAEISQKVVFMRKRIIKIYEVPMNSLNWFSISSLLFSFFLTAAAAFWTGYKTAWDHPGAFAAAIAMSIFAFLFLCFAVGIYLGMRIGTEPFPYPSKRESD